MEELNVRVGEFSISLYQEDVKSGCLLEIMAEYADQTMVRYLAIYMLGAVSFAQAVKEGRFEL